MPIKIAYQRGKETSTKTIKKLQTSRKRKRHLHRGNYE